MCVPPEYAYYLNHPFRFVIVFSISSPEKRLAYYVEREDVQPRNGNKECVEKRNADIWIKKLEECVETCTGLLLPRDLVCWAREYRYGWDLIETTSNRLLISLPALTGAVVDKGALSEGVGGASSLGSEGSTGCLWSLLLVCWW